MPAPTYNLSATIGIAINSQFQQIADNVSTDNFILGGGKVLPFQLQLRNGSGDVQASNAWHDQRTVAPAANDDIYLNGNPAFVNKFGVPLNLTNVKAVFLRMLTGAIGRKLVLGNHPTAPWKWDFDAATDKEDFADFILRGNSHDGWPVGGVTSPAVAPTVAASGTGGTIPAATYYVKTTYNTPAGESLASPANAGTPVTLGQNLVITSPAATPGATTYNVYVASAPGGPFVLQGTPTAIGTNKTLATFSTSGATPPVATSAYQNSILRFNNPSAVAMTYDIALWGSP